MRLVALLAMALGLSGCAIAALPVVSQVPLWTAIAAGTAAATGTVLNVQMIKQNEDNAKK